VLPFPATELFSSKTANIGQIRYHHWGWHARGSENGA